MASHALVIAALAAHPGLAALVGTRIRVDYAEAADRYPFVVVKRADFSRTPDLSGAVNLITETFEVECWGEDRVQAVNLMEQALLALDAADLPPERGQPDGVDPELLNKVCVLVVDVLTEP